MQWELCGWQCAGNVHEELEEELSRELLLDVNSNEIENVRSDVEVIDLNQLGQQLRDKVNKYLARKSIKIRLLEEHIIDLEFVNDRIKCKVICPSC